MFNRNNIQRYLQKADMYNWGIDHLTLNLKKPIFFLKDILDTLDFDNSNIAIQTIGNYETTFTKAYFKNGSFLSIAISIDNIPFTIFQYLEYNERNKRFLKSEGSFTYYSTYFRLTEMNKLPYFYEKDFFQKEIETLWNS
jgi:hypothetical protein